MTFTSDLNYGTYISQIATLTAISSGNAQFQTMIPPMIDYAEQRIYREADFLANYCIDDTGSAAANVQQFFYPTSMGYFLVIDQINVLTSPSTSITSSAVTSSNAIRVPLQVASRQFVQTVYPSAATAVGTPNYFAMMDDLSCFLGPTPDQNYNIEVIGTQRPQSLSASNSSTFLTQVLPDLFVAASMIFISGYMQNFGAQADNSGMAQSWSGQYDKLFQSAITEEFRKKYQSEGWQGQPPSPIATPKRA